MEYVMVRCTVQVLLATLCKLINQVINKYIGNGVIW